jgi:hypothetical protein
MQETNSRLQREMIEKSRAESCIDPLVRLPEKAQIAYPLHGPSVADYFRAKHAAGKVGAFFPLRRLWTNNSRNFES